jgi:hypothetical protein
MQRIRIHKSEVRIRIFPFPLKCVETQKFIKKLNFLRLKMMYLWLSYKKEFFLHP